MVKAFHRVQGVSLVSLVGVVPRTTEDSVVRLTMSAPQTLVRTGSASENGVTAEVPEEEIATAPSEEPLRAPPSVQVIVLGTTAENLECA